MRELIISANDSGQRLDKFLSKTLRTLPASLMYKAIRTKKIKVNRARAQQNTMLYEGDTVQCFLAEEFFLPLDNPDTAYLSLKPKLEIVFEDENILLVDKKPGVLCHSDEEGDFNTLIDNIKAYLYQKGEYDPAGEMSFAPALCNRIDRNTGGIVIAAKNAAALRDMNERIKNKEVTKLYLCAVHGIPKKKSDTLTAYLVKDAASNTVKIYPSEAPGRMKIITEYRILKEKGDTSLLEIHLITGKTHQIRSHMAYIGYPLLGDGKYGVNREDKRAGYAHQALYSYKIRFDFKTDGILSYLTGREFTCDEKNIRFLEEYK